MIMINSHPATAPYMAPLVMDHELSSDSHWGWPSGKSCVPLLARRRFKTACNNFFIFVFASIAEIPTWIFYDRDRNNLYLIDCIGDYYYYINNSESYPTLIY